PRSAATAWLTSSRGRHGFRSSLPCPGLRSGTFPGLGGNVGPHRPPYHASTMRTGRLPRWRYYVRRDVAAGIVLVVFVGLAVATGAACDWCRFYQVRKVHLANLRAPMASRSQPSVNILIVG